MATGRIKRWNAEQGFGFIHSDEVDGDIFAHISDFKDKDLTPSVGDDVKQTKKGLQAKKIHYPNRLARPLTTTYTPHPRSQTGLSSTILLKLVIFAILVIGGYYAFQKYQAKQQLNELSKPVHSTNAPSPSAQITQNNTNFKCDGRTKCSQMTSREEANYFVAHCPNTEMDGDHHGQACENDSRW